MKTKKEFNFKDTHTNIEKLFSYAKYKFPKHRTRLEFDEWGQFVMFKKNSDTTIFYYVNNAGSLCYNVYKKMVAKIDKPIIKDFKHRIYTAEKMKEIFDKILVPLT